MNIAKGYLVVVFGGYAKHESLSEALRLAKREAGIKKATKALIYAVDGGLAGIWFDGQGAAWDQSAGNVMKLTAEKI